MARIKIAGYKLHLPRNRVLRVALGLVLILGGLLGFLPILGFWMIPVGLTVLAVDMPAVRRFQRRANVYLGNKLYRRWPGFARKLGFGEPRDHRKS